MKGVKKVILERNLECKMRDGIVLRADAYLPDAAGKFPLLLCRTPYSKERDQDVEIGHKMAERGYVVVILDVRGRFASDGEFKPGFYSADHCDREDGYDTVEWAASLPWTTGKVGTFGNSYNGWTQWELADTRPPHLVCMFATGIAANLLDRELGGVLRLGRVLFWTINTLSPDERRRAGVKWGPKTVAEAEELWAWRDKHKWLWHLPLLEIPESVMSGMYGHFKRWLENHARDHFCFTDRHKDVNVPVLSATGWYDQQIGTIKQFTGMVKNGMTPYARENQHLIVGPWTHTTLELNRKVGEVDFGPEGMRNYYQIADAWFGKWLKDEKTEADEWPPIQLFVMGANCWRGENEWPLGRTRWTQYYLHSNGSANTAVGDGALSLQTPGEEPPDAYVYDPRDPVMTLYNPNGQQEPWDQRRADGRKDVLAYQTAPLQSPLEVTGPVTVKLWAASSARDTDFVVKLHDVWPGGFVQELCHGIVRARYRESYESPSLINAGEVYEYTIEVNPTSNLFKKGHRIRVDISSSDFPNFDRNLNTGGKEYADPTITVARQTVFHDAARPSRIILPVIPRD